MGTHHDGTEEEIFSLNAFIKLMRATETINYSLNKQLSEHNLTASQFGVLEALLHLGPLNQKTLGQKLLKSGGNMTLVIDNLQKEGLVERRQNPEDRRATMVSLTDKGEELINTVFPKHMANIVSQFSVLSNSEKKTLGSLCKKLGTANQNNV